MKTLLLAIVVCVSAISLWAQGQLSQTFAIEANRNLTQISEDFAMPLLPPTPLTDSSSGILPGFQTPALPIQAIPEPSTFTLGCFALGLIAMARFFRKQRLASKI